MRFATELLKLCVELWRDILGIGSKPTIVNVGSFAVFRSCHARLTVLCFLIFFACFALATTTACICPESLVRINDVYRYVFLYEKITGKDFLPPDLSMPINKRMDAAVLAALNL